MSFSYPIRGVFWPQDEFGRVLNIAVKREELSPLWSNLSESAVDYAHERFEQDLHSVYLTGPAARNRPGGGSIFIVLHKNAKSSNAPSWCVSAAEALRRDHNCKFGLNIHVLKWHQVFSPMGRYSQAKFRLSVNSVCVGGRPVTRLITPQCVNEAVANPMLVTFENRLKQAKQKTLTSDSRRIIRSVSANVGHAIVSAGYASVIAAEQTYTEDLDIRRDIFSLYHPERAEDIQRAYDMSALPSYDPVQVRSFINEASEWVLPLVDEWLNTNNPKRVELLSV
ncbi:hypothetical protein [Hirschia baltica]|uniref:Uncharacterized protein n=1 Tax=Hirschia baltica (strain ATCC 49814 / DSM 5838 / IFAM 1418) TaxID=582402 RepID=C6XMZ1_HIRBI|nr:hypothetical protein [Hirschia baltica]ACT58161.1 hypothetical protein Hbal_0459 [Hirschia baltica ATCC 49814]